MNLSASDIINALNLSPHPEGGYFKETYRNTEVIPHSQHNYSTAIYYMLAKGDKSHLHRIKQDEIWHFYLGGSLRLCTISPEGKYREIIMGQRILNGECLQYVVPAGWWFGASPAEGSEWSLVSCTVAPGFDFADFEMADRKYLITQFPHLEAFIREFSLIDSPQSGFQCSFDKCQLHFKQPAQTSRGAYSVRDIWYVKIQSVEQPERFGIGECAPLPDLSCDALPDYEQILAGACRHLEQEGRLDTERLRSYPSILFGLETAVRHFEAGSYSLWNTPFSRGEAGIPINGLIWMSDYSNMLKQIEAKLSAGFRCIKLKIGAIGFEEELALLRFIRNHFSVKDLELRVDANGAFSPDDAQDKLSRLAELDIHSIEQPIRAGQWEAMAQLIAGTSLPVALDEELIGIHSLEEKRKLLTAIHPRYIILKPSLHGGFCGCDEWIDEAGKLGIGWWMTSALESNIGLNAIAQKCATYDNPLPQGLGTGQLFTDNIELPLFVRKDCLWYKTACF